jgi:hypothetical protein
VIALRSGGWKDVDLEGAIAVYDGPAALAASLAESPIAWDFTDEREQPLMRSRRSAMRGI